jgi:hypothetical protein
MASEGGQGTRSSPCLLFSSSIYGEPGARYLDARTQRFVSDTLVCFTPLVAITWADESLHEVRVSSAEFNVFPESSQWGLRIHAIDLLHRHCTLAHALAPPTRFSASLVSPSSWQPDEGRMSEAGMSAALLAAASTAMLAPLPGSVTGLKVPVSVQGLPGSGPVTGVGVGGGGTGHNGGAVGGSTGERCSGAQHGSADTGPWTKEALSRPVSFPDGDTYMHVGSFCIEECPVQVVRYPQSPGLHAPNFDTTVVDMFAHGMSAPARCVVIVLWGCCGCAFL